MAFPVVAAVTAGVGALEYLGAQEARRASDYQARRQMAFQEYMSSTAYQRAVKDMRMAGINPMLAYMQGGASSPGGAMADVESMVSPAVSSAMHAKRLSEEVKNLAGQRELMHQQAGRETSQRRLNVTLDAEAGARRDHLRLQNRMIEAELPHALNVAKFEQGRMGFTSTAIRRMREALFGGQTPLMFPIPYQRR